MRIRFYKYQGTGNDFIMIDDRDKSFPANDTGLIARLCHRRFGIGADGLILLQPLEGYDFYMQYFNSDGRESSMCGNGGRCIVAFAHQLGVIKNETKFMAIDGEHEAKIEGQRVELKMKDIDNIDIRDADTYVLNTGSPHYVSFTKEDIHHKDIVTLARTIRYGAEFKNEGINVNFANQSGESVIQMRTYERGVEDETLSCGTGVTATAIALAVRNKKNTGEHGVHVMVMGGRLDVSFMYDSALNQANNVWLKGPAVFVYEGDIDFKSVN